MAQPMMRTRSRAHWTVLTHAMAITIALAVAFHVLPTSAQESPTTSDASELMGAPVFAADGPEVGEVSAVAMMADGTITELRVTTASPLGLGTRTVVLPPSRYTPLRGAVVIDLSAEEFDGLPSVGKTR